MTVQYFGLFAKGGCQSPMSGPDDKSTLKHKTFYSSCLMRKVDIEEYNLLLI